MQYRSTNTVLHDSIRQLFELDTHGCHQMSGTEIRQYLRQAGIDLGGTARSQEVRLATVLKQLGVKRIRRATWRGYSGIQPKQIQQQKSINSVLPDWLHRQVFLLKDTDVELARAVYELAISLEK